MAGRMSYREGLLDDQVRGRETADEVLNSPRLATLGATLKIKSRQPPSVFRRSFELTLRRVAGQS